MNTIRFVFNFKYIYKNLNFHVSLWDFPITYMAYVDTIETGIWN